MSAQSSHRELSGYGTTSSTSGASTSRQLRLWKRSDGRAGGGPGAQRAQGRAEQAGDEVRRHAQGESREVGELLLPQRRHQGDRGDGRLWQTRGVADMEGFLAANPSLLVNAARNKKHK
eukprot:766779-Hanusia_phi.AAC.2